MRNVPILAANRHAVCGFVQHIELTSNINLTTLANTATNITKKNFRVL